MKINVKIQDTTYEVTIGDINERPVKAIIDGETFEVWPEESKHSQTSAVASPTTNQTAEDIQPSAPTESSIITSNELRAPIPGVIIDIVVKAGDNVQIGQELCILEAMKMKNSIRANHAGTIEEILTKVGDQVKHGQILLRFKD
ncbi:MAG: Biotin/lipoyl attachment domain-containing protein [Anaerolinea thermophila]|uniref:Biotin/lipoyl attachment domain-containing protein n=1 Tax=Anaerolinea thermophila TaxID=167964 RepID=A0A101FYJ2_9CHLR|nr:MAG: Biotin/lipoyl attachment domain-containing protein [Anaerolinea thermophila]